MIGSAAESLVAAARLAWASAAHWLIARVVLAGAIGLVPVTVAWLLKLVLDRLVQPGPPLTGPVLLLAGAGIAAVVLPEVARYADAELQRAVGLVARHRLYDAVGRIAGLARFEDPRFHDRLSLAAESGPIGPPEVVSSALGVVQGLLTLASFLVALAALNPWMLAFVALAAVPTLAAELRLSRHRAKLLWELGHAARREFFYAHLMTSVTAAKEVRLYGLGGLFGARMLAELRQIHAGHRRMDRRELAAQSLQATLGAAVAGLGLIWAVNAAQAGRLTVGDVSVFFAAVAGVQGGLSASIANAGRAHEAILLFGHYRHVVDAPPDLPVADPHPEPPRAPVELPPAGAHAPGSPFGARAAPSLRGSPPGVPPLRQGIELEDVWFRYDDELPWVLRGVSLTIPAGAATALVGHNGAGKSTLVKLLCRFYDPTRGAIRWDGLDLRELPLPELRARIGAVFQDFMAYDLSAADNVGLGDVLFLDDRERVTAAARRAGVHHVVAALPRGYDTLLTRVYMDPNDRDDPATGVVLSDGQWQRVAIARAFMRDGCDLLILDEPSAGLDAEAEHELARGLRAHRAGRSSLLLSHRLNAVREADTIVALSDGVVAEQGTHAELLEAGGIYAHLFRLQAAGYGPAEALGASAPPHPGR